MHVLFLHSYFCTKNSTASSRSYELCKSLINRGHDVTVVCQVVDTNKIVFRNMSGLFKEITLDDIRIVGINVAYSNNMNIIRRLFSFFLFMIFSCYACARVKNIDIVFATSTPPTIAVPALFIKFFRGVPFIFELRDIWPDFVEQLDVLPGVPKWVFRSIDKCMIQIYKWADFVTTTTLGMTGIIAHKGVKKEKLGTILLGANRGHFKGKVFPHPVLKAPILKDKFVVTFLGSISYGYGLTHLLEVANKMLSINTKIAFLLLGRGNCFQEISDKIKEMALVNVHIEPAIEYRDVPRILKFVHVGYESSLPSSASDCALDNKFYDYISAGLPIVSNYDGDMGELIQRYNVGYVSKTIDDEVYILNKMERDRSYLKNLADNAEILSKEVDIEKQKILFVEMIERIGAFRYPEST